MNRIPIQHSAFSTVGSTRALPQRTHLTYCRQLPDRNLDFDNLVRTVLAITRPEPYALPMKPSAYVAYRTSSMKDKIFESHIHCNLLQFLKRSITITSMISQRNLTSIATSQSSELHPEII